MKTVWTVMFVLICNFFVFAQNKETDSLLHVFSKAKNDSVKVSVLNKIAYQYIFNDEKTAQNYLKKSEKIALSKNIKYGYDELINIKGIFCDITGKSDSAKYYFLQAYKNSIKHKFPTIEVRSVNNLGMYCWNRGQFKEALDYFFKALKINESLPEDKKIKASICYSNIGLIYQEMKLFDKAIAYHKMAYDLRVKDKMYKEQAVSLNNIGICYRNKKEYQKAISTFTKGISIAKQSNNQIEYSKLLENLASVYIDLEQYNKALRYHLFSEKIRKNIPHNDKEVLLLNIYIAISYNKLKDYKKSLEYCNKSFATIKANTSLNSYAVDLYKTAASSYYAMGNTKQGDYYNTMYYNLLKDSFSANNSKDLAEMETKYQTEKKEKELLKAKNEIILKEIQNKQKAIWLIIISLLTVFTAMVGYLFFRQQKLKNTQQEQEFQLKTAISQIETQNKLQEQRLAISRDLHDNIGAQLTFIISSVENLKFGFPNIDNKIKNQLTKVGDFTRETIIELRDTIWAMNSNEFAIQDLKIRLTNFIEKAKVANNTIDFQFSIDDNLKDEKLTSIVGINIYRTIQEAVNNAMKYSNASQIIINAEKSNQKLQISISDNGKGFDLETVDFGNGLHNMKKRIEEINGSFEIISEERKGTKIIVQYQK